MCRHFPVISAEPKAVQKFWSTPTESFCTLQIEATIGPDGAVKDAKVLRSIPLLDQAALDAVRQWVFTPTLLNGVPVPVIMTVTVQFTLQ